jgi:phage N-6-adenine-methyltransferase
MGEGRELAIQQMVSYGATRKMPVQKPGRSKQDYATPDDFILAVKRRWGIKAFAYDLAADAENAKSRYFFCEEEDSLRQAWTKLKGDLWLNPPFANIAPWAAKCKESTRTPGRRIFFLTPASVGANWFAEHVWRHAHVLALQGRLSFDGKDPYPKDCILSLYDAEDTRRGQNFEVWDWRGPFT